MRRKSTFFIVILAVASCFSCKKNKEVDLHLNLNVATDVVLLHRPFVYVSAMVVKAMVDSTLQATHHAFIDSALVTLDTVNNWYKFQFNGRQCGDSVSRIGSFTARVSKDFFDKGSVTIIDFEQYFEDIHHVSGVDSIVCTGILDGSYRFDCNIKNAIVTKTPSSHIHWNANMYFSVDGNILISGTNKLELKFYGTSTGISSREIPFSTEISHPLVVNNCPWIIDGTITLNTPQLDVSDGTIGFIAGASCNDEIKYDFEGNLLFLRMTEKFLKY